MSLRHRTNGRASRFALAMIGAAVTLGLAGAGPAEAAVIVLRSQGAVVQTVFKPGAPMRPGQRIELAEREELWLLDNSGTRVLRGPGRWVLDETRSAHGVGRLAALLEYSIIDGKEYRRPIVAATRSAAPGSRMAEAKGPPPEPGPAELDRLLGVTNIYQADGRYCVWGAKIRFVQGRGGARDNAPARLITAAGPITLTFTDGQSDEIAVDRLSAGAGEVTIEADGARHPTRFSRIAAPKTLEGLAVDAAKAGCDTTLILMGRAFHVRD